MSSPRERRHDLTRQKILDTARQIILNQGLDGFSMRVLAEQIDYSPSAIYKYFDNKEEILQAIREESWARSAAAQAEKLTANLPPPERLYAAGKAYLEFAETNPEHYLLMFNAPDESIGDASDIGQDARFGGIAGLVQEGVDTGYFKLPPGYTPLMMAFHLWISVHGIAMLKLTLMRHAHAEFDALCDQIMKAFIGSFTVS
jgi:AcrR family transcriptional regulator